MIAPGRIAYDDSTHTYWIDGVRVPSITQALKVATYDDFDRVDPQTLKRKADQGTALAKMIEEYADGTFDETLERYDLDLLPDFDAFVEWHEKERGRILQCETIAASARYGYAGRLDLVYVFGGDSGFSIIDTKRTWSPPASGGPQTAAQAMAFVETGGLPVDPKNVPRYLLHIKDGGCTLVPKRDKDDFKVFLAALTVTKWRMKNGKHL